MITNIQLSPSVYLRVESDSIGVLLTTIWHTEDHSQFEHRDTILIPTSQLENLIEQLNKAKQELIK